MSKTDAVFIGIGVGIGVMIGHALTNVASQVLGRTSFSPAKAS